MDGEETFRALKFVKASVLNSQGGSGKPWTGFIEVKFSEALEDGIRMQKDHAGSWQATATQKGRRTAKTWVPSMGGDKKKGVRSRGGTSATTVATKRHRRMHYRSGAVLKQIRLQYCTTVGLIENKLLPKPPGWELDRFRVLKPAPQNPTAPHLKLKPQEVVMTGSEA